MVFGVRKAQALLPPVTAWGAKQQCTKGKGERTNSGRGAQSAAQLPPLRL